MTKQDKLKDKLNCKKQYRLDWLQIEKDCLILNMDFAVTIKEITKYERQIEIVEEIISIISKEVNNE